MSPPLIKVQNLKKYFPVKAGVFQKTVANVRAVDDISFDIQLGETLSLVGESGCGKTTAGKSMINLIRPTSGKVLLNTNQNDEENSYVDVAAFGKAKRKQIRRELQIIFQNPYNSLNPRMTVGQMLKELLRFHHIAKTTAQARDRIQEILNVVGLQPSDVDKYPHEFSGGQRQRIGIARALLLEPKLIVCDEPVSALDVSIQAQIINLLIKLRRELNLTYLFIAHDLAVVRHISERVAVMYLGKIVEIAPKQALYLKPVHPYTEALLSAVPIPDPDSVCRRIILPGEAPSPMNLPPGCRFRSRCSLAKKICAEQEPELTPRDHGHFAACHVC